MSQENRRNLTLNYDVAKVNFLQLQVVDNFPPSFSIILICTESAVTQAVISPKNRNLNLGHSKFC